MNETDFIKIYTQSDPAGGRALRVSTVYSDSSGIYTASDPNGGRVLKVSLIGGMGTAITVVTNYSALPPANQQTGKFYWCQEPQGTWWLPGSLGGTYYPRGLYYSNGTAWEYMDVPFEATQAEVDAGVDNSKFVTPLTFANASKWSNFPYTKDADGNVFYDGVTATLGTGCSNNIFHQGATSNVLGTNCSNNIFYQDATSNVLGNACTRNTFEQFAGGITLGESCINNTFKQGAQTFVFGDNLQNVTIESGTSGNNYTASPDYDFLYGNSYPATIFNDGSTLYHSYYDVANDRIVLTNLGTLAVSYIGGSGGGGSTILKGTASGTDTYTTTITGVTSYTDGDAYLIRFTNGNTTGSTLNINALGAKTLYRNNDGALIGGDIWADGEMLCIFNSTLDGFQCIGTSPNSLFAYVTNAESVTINKGQPVYAFGAAGNRMSVKLANNTSDATSAKTVGIVYSTSIAANQKGIIIIQGMLEGLSSFPLSTWADGDTVYLGATAGAITKTKPYAPNHLVYLGIVTTASNGSAGRMYVRVQNGYEMDELHDVAAQNPNNGDLLKYNSSTSLWETAPDLSLAYAYIFG